jgi:hypothetical protein
MPSLDGARRVLQVSAAGNGENFRNGLNIIDIFRPSSPEHGSPGEPGTIRGRRLI